MRRVVLESPFAGDVEGNIEYAKACILDCLSRGDAPIVSHLLFTQPGILHDDVPEHRQLGMQAGHTWIPAAEAVVVYQDRGVSAGMRAAVEIARIERIPVEYRRLYGKDNVDDVPL